MAQSEWKSSWTRGGRIPEVAWVDKEVMAWCCGVHVVFFHVAKRLQTLWRCPESVDGVSCISSNQQLHLLALSESCLNPRVLILTYPNMKIVAECKGGSENGYLATAFASSDLLVALASHPEYALILWNWRTGRKLHSIETEVSDLQGQMIRVSGSRPTYVVQLAKTAERLLIWQIMGNSVSPMSEEVVLPKKAAPVHADWSPDPLEPILAIADDSGHVYLCDKDGGSPTRIVFSQRCATCVDYEVPAVCWWADGILLKTTFCQMRLYKKVGESWRRQWYIKTPLKPYILSAHPHKKDRLFFFAMEGDVMQLTVGDQNSTNVEKIFDCRSSFKFLDLVYPHRKYLVALQDVKNAVVLNSSNGEELGRLQLELKGEVTNFVAHFDYPMIAISSSAGEVLLLALCDAKQLKPLSKFRFDTEELNLVRFSQCGRHLMVGRQRSGNFYCLKSFHESLSSIRKIEVAHQVLDVAIFESDNVLTILMLILPFKRAVAGNCMLIYKLHHSEDTLREPVSVLKLPRLYDHLQYGLTPTSLAATPFSSRLLHCFKVKGDQLSLVNALQSPHQVRGIKVTGNRDRIITCGFDGIVGVLKSLDTSEFAVSLRSHHRVDMGVVRAVLNPSGSRMVALGANGSLICMELQESRANSEQSIEFVAVVSQQLEVSIQSKLSPEIVQWLSRDCQVIPPDDSGVETWTDWMEKLQLMKEEEDCREEKSKILEDLAKLSSEVSRLLDENEKFSEEQRLPIAAFDLDQLGREHKLKTAKEQREDLKLELEFNCSEMERVTSWLKKTYWDPQKVKAQSLFAIFGDTEVTNFPTASVDPQEQQMDRWFDMCTQTENLDEPSSEPESFVLLRSRYTPSSKDEKTIAESINEEEDEDVIKEWEEEVQAAAGHTTFKFVEASSSFCQFKRYTFTELRDQNKALIVDVQNLKSYFNKLFNEAFATKERIMTSVIEKVSHIRFIDSELRLMFDSSVPEIPDEPKWFPKERPESVITATDDEVPAQPYVSPSEQELLARKAEEQERIRLEMLADDFRQRALMKMMNGVLEVRWEDIIKQNPPKPDFMLEKKPEDFTKEEIIMVQSYEQELQHLAQERERYRGILETTYAKMTKSLHEIVDKFNSNLQQLLVTRLKVESAILQLDLFRARSYLKVAHWMKLQKEEEHLKEQMLQQQEKIEKIKFVINILQEQLLPLQTHRETLLGKEKAMTKKLKAEFPSLGKTSLDVLRKQFKRRPKVQLKNPTSADVLILTKYIASKEASLLLRADCRDYLRQLEALDVRPEGLPESIQCPHWELLVKLRRHAVELELKIKANSLEISDVEQLIADNNRKIERCTEATSNFSEDLKKLHAEKLNFVQDEEIQLVLKLGQVEIDLQGQREETKVAELIPVDVVHRLNEDILKAGDKKLRELQRTLEFHRGVALKEWEHKCLQMEIEDLQVELADIDGTLVTKQMQDYLRRQAAGLKTGKTVQELERQMRAMERISAKTVNDWRLRLEAIEAQIEARRRENSELDRQIEELNVGRWEAELKRDLELEDLSEKFSQWKMEALRHRARLCRKIQRTYNDVQALKLESQLLRMKTYPAIPGCDVVGQSCPRDETRN